MKILVRLRPFIVHIDICGTCHSFLCPFSAAALLNLTQNKVWLVYGRKWQGKWTLEGRNVFWWSREGNEVMQSWRRLSCPRRSAKAVIDPCHIPAKDLCDPCSQKLFGGALASLICAVWDLSDPPSLPHPSAKACSPSSKFQHWRLLTPGRCLWVSPWCRVLVINPLQLYHWGSSVSCHQSQLSSWHPLACSPGV